VFLRKFHGNKFLKIKVKRHGKRRCKYGYVNKNRRALTWDRIQGSGIRGRFLNPDLCKKVYLAATGQGKLFYIWFV